jgi:hypothetical protein
LSQWRAGEILSGGARAFQKYEAGTQSDSDPMSRLLTILENDLALLEKLSPDSSASRPSLPKRYPSDDPRSRGPLLGPQINSKEFRKRADSIQIT